MTAYPVKHPSLAFHVSFLVFSLSKHSFSVSLEWHSCLPFCLFTHPSKIWVPYFISQHSLLGLQIGIYKHYLHSLSDYCGLYRSWYDIRIHLKLWKAVPFFIWKTHMQFNSLGFSYYNWLLVFPFPNFVSCFHLLYLQNYTLELHFSLISKTLMVI